MENIKKILHARDIWSLEINRQCEDLRKKKI